MTAIPRHTPHRGPVVLSAGFRPFFLGSAIWAAVAIPLWLAFYRGEAAAPSLMAPVIWHAHEMIFGFAAATVAGFLLTAIPNCLFAVLYYGALARPRVQGAGATAT